LLYYNKILYRNLDFVNKKVDAINNKYLLLSGFVTIMCTYKNNERNAYEKHYLGFAKTTQFSVEHFSKGSEYSNVKISPKGTYLAVMTQPEGKNILLILDAKNFQLKHGVQFPSNAQVGNYHWVNDERVVLEKQYLKG